MQSNRFKTDIITLFLWKVIPLIESRKMLTYVYVQKWRLWIISNTQICFKRRYYREIYENTDIKNK